MPWKRNMVLVLSFAAACSCAIAEPPRENEARRGARILVVPRAGLALEALDEILRAHGARRVGAIPQINVHIVEVESGSDPHALAKLLEKLPQIKDAEVDERVPPATRSSTPQPR